ncbi:MAG: IS5 family transposase [Cyclobacteriaceae bacterium]
MGSYGGRAIKPFVNWQRKRELDLRDVFDAILWITRTRAQWRNLDSQFPDWSAVYYYFRKWTRNKTLEKMTIAVNIVERIEQGRSPTPSLGLADSQSVKLAPMMVKGRGIDGNKQVNGRKRHLLVDVLGRIWRRHVYAANGHDSPAGVNLLKEIKTLMPTLKKIIADKSYRGTFARAVEEEKLSFETPMREEGRKGFVVEAKRWVVERTFAGLNFFRRTVVDYERTTESAQSFLLIANISIVLWRIDC